MADDEKENPRTTSSDYNAMAPFWRKVDAILGGVETMRATGSHSVFGPAQAVPLLSQLNRGRHGPESPYLPRFPNETSTDYEFRRKTAPMANLYGDISRNLASTPFSKPCELAEDSGDDLKKIAENIDGLGNNHHVFARETFKVGLDKGMTFILVEYPAVPTNMILSEERDQKVQPYWVHIPPERMLAIYSMFIRGKAIIYHARIDQACMEISGYKEEWYNRVREFNRAPIIDGARNVIGFEPATWVVKEEVTEKDAAGKEATTWVVKESGTITIGIIPIVAFFTGKRHGASWKCDAPLRDLVDMQIAGFHQESNLSAISDQTCYPMLTANGIPSKDESGQKIEVPVGPYAVLWAPPNSDGNHGTWDSLEPEGTSLSFLDTRVEKHYRRMKDLGMQPLTEAQLTVITTANVAMKAHNALEAWALGLKDALEQAWKYTVMWLGQKVEPVVSVHRDFAVELEAGPELDSLAKAEASSVISKRLYFNELKRRGVIADDADWDDDQEQMAEQQQGLEPEQPIDPRGGRPLEIDPLTGRPVVAKPKLVG